MRRLLFLIFAVILSLVELAPQPAHASGTVGNGTPQSCTDAAFNTALSGGGPVNFNCGPNPVTITLTPGKTISANTTIDGSTLGLITLTTNGPGDLFTVNSGITLTVQNLTISNSSNLAVPF